MKKQETLVRSVVRPSASGPGTVTILQSVQVTIEWPEELPFLPLYGHAEPWQIIDTVRPNESTEKHLENLSLAAWSLMQTLNHFYSEKVSRREEGSIEEIRSRMELVRQHVNATQQYLFDLKNRKEKG